MRRLYQGLGCEGAVGGKLLGHTLVELDGLPQVSIGLLERDGLLKQF
jgi:hypothetical protein